MLSSNIRNDVIKEIIPKTTEEHSGRVANKLTPNVLQKQITKPKQGHKNNARKRNYVADDDSDDDSDKEKDVDVTDDENSVSDDHESNDDDNVSDADDGDDENNHTVEKLVIQRSNKRGGDVQVSKRPEGVKESSEDDFEKSDGKVSTCKRNLSQKISLKQRLSYEGSGMYNRKFDNDTSGTRGQRIEKRRASFNVHDNFVIAVDEH